MKIFGLKVHCGEPKHPTEIRAWTGALGNNNEPWTHRYVSHEVGRWLGISYKRNWFVGIFLIARSDDYRTKERPRFGWGSQIGERPNDIPAAEGDDPTPQKDRDHG